MFEEPYKAIPEPRGCGEREPGGVYVECGVGPGGTPIETFLFDPPLPLPEGVDLVNKPQLWLRTDPASGEPVLDAQGKPIYDVLVWVGAEHYPEAADYIEETRRLGASRRLNPQMDLTRITRWSRMLLAHPRAIIENWREMEPPQRCCKNQAYHSKLFYDLALSNQEASSSSEDAAVLYERYKNEQRLGPCISKLWDILPKDEAIETFERPGDLPLCLRRIGSTTYHYAPTGEPVTGWKPGFILGLPISNIALIQYADGSVNERAKKKLVKGQEENREHAIPFYETEH
jgi:hypothetical protein